MLAAPCLYDLRHALSQCGEPFIVTVLYKIHLSGRMPKLFLCVCITAGTQQQLPVSAV